MNGHIDAERILDAFLAPESDRLPDRVIEAALSDISRTPQRRALRVPWRFPHMPALNRATVVAAVVLVAVVGVGGALYLTRPSIGGPGGQPTPGPTASPAAATYTSARYGFSMEHPSGWLIVPAQSDWRLGDVHGIGSRWVDVLDDPNSGVALYAARQPLEPGTTAEEWLDQNIDLKSADSGICGDMSPQAYQPVEVQGEAGRQITTVCSSAQGVNYYAAALVVHDGSGYLISYARSGGEEPGDDEAFARLVASFAFPVA